MVEAWKKCSSCKDSIPFGQKYYVCSVSTCQGKVTNYAFCSVGCWDAHLPIERHRSDSAGAIERTAPLSAAPVYAPAGGDAAARRVIPAASKAAVTKTDDEILVVVSKVRKYVADKSGMNTSAEVYVTLTEKIKWLCDNAIDHARSQSRKTIMTRDFN